MCPNPLFSGGFVPDASVNQPQALTVSQAINLINTRFKGFPLTVEGELSSVTDNRGYFAVYFALSDEKKSKLECLMWRNQYHALGIKLEVGQQVRVSGVLEVYNQTGKLSLKASTISLVGEGALRARVAALARRLEQEGLFEASNKRALPHFPQHIAVVTSPRGDAIHDVLRTLRRRAPHIHLSVAGVQVEGGGAEDQIIEGLRCAQAAHPDIVLLVRGGGSYESLMPFNDERVVRAIAAMSVPVITGIGHEPDHTIADMVADVRASTPTAAAEISCPSCDDLQAQINGYHQQLNHVMLTHIQRMRHMLEQLSTRSVMRHPYEYVVAYFARAVDEIQRSFDTAIPRSLERRYEAINLLELRLSSLGHTLLQGVTHSIDASAHKLMLSGEHLLADKSDQLAQATQHLRMFGSRGLTDYAAQIRNQAGKLEALSPLGVLARGYSLLYASEGASSALITSASQVAEGDEVSVHLQDGEIYAQVTRIEPSE